MLHVAGYELDAERRYDPDTNLWVSELGDGLVRIGFDPLGAETTGDIVAISFAPAGTRVSRGEPFATVEAAKFVGPLAAPVAGVIGAANPTALDSPGVLNADPLGTWVVEFEGVEREQLDALVSGEAEIAEWFAGALERYRSQGAIAE